MKNRAFTLIELTVVLLIIGLVAGIVGIRMAGPISRVKLQDVVEQVRRFDSNTRSYAWQQDRKFKVNVDTDKNAIYRFDDDEKQVGRELVLPVDFKIEEFRIANEDEQATADSLIYSNRGLSRSYAIRLANKDNSRWMFFVGLTGQVLEIEDDEKISKIMESLLRPDTD